MVDQAQSSTVWGVAGNAIAVRGEPEVVTVMNKWAAAFTVESSPALELTVRNCPDASPEAKVAPGISFDGDKVYYSSHVAHGCADFGAAWGELALLGEGASNWYEVDYFLRVLLGVVALKQGSLLFHGAGVIDAGYAWVLFGSSGAGKSTAARVSGPRRVLHDDLLVLSRDGYGWQVHATPFVSTSGLRPEAPISERLVGLCYLVQDEQVRADLLSRGSAMARLLECVPVVTSSPRLAGQAMEVCHSLAKDVPCYDLHFRPAPSFWEVLHDFQ